MTETRKSFLEFLESLDDEDQDEHLKLYTKRTREVWQMFEDNVPLDILHYPRVAPQMDGEGINLQFSFEDAFIYIDIEDQWGELDWMISYRDKPGPDIVQPLGEEVYTLDEGFFEKVREIFKNNLTNTK